MNAVIHRASFQKVKSYQDYAKQNPGECEVVVGGGAEDSVGWFVQPTVVRVKSARNKLMQEGRWQN